MNKQHRRFIFIDFENLKKIKFKKLEKVCEKIFVFINANEKAIPFMLVKQMQALGKNVKWIVVDSPIESKLDHHICFMLGRLHQKMDKSVEFAILSNDKSFDGLVSFINETGRSCLRVKRKKSAEVKHEQEAFEVPVEEIVPPPSESEIIRSSAINVPTFDISDSNGGSKAQDVIYENDMPDNEEISITARKTVERLVKSGNRPLDISMLKNYILLHNKNLAAQGGVDMIIEHLEETQEIKVNKGEVTYNF